MDAKLQPLYKWPGSKSAPIFRGSVPGGAGRSPQPKPRLFTDPNPIGHLTSPVTVGTVGTVGTVAWRGVVIPEIGCMTTSHFWDLVSCIAIPQKRLNSRIPLKEW